MKQEKNFSDELAEQGKHARIERKKQEQIDKKKAKANGIIYRRKRDQRSVFMHFNAWYRWRGVFFQNGIIILVVGVITLFILPEAFPRSVILIISGFGAVLFCLYFYIRRSVHLTALQEKEWIDSLPFELIAYPDILVYRSYPSVYFTIKFKEKKPEVDYLLDIFATLPYEVSSEVKYKESNIIYKFQMNNEKASKFDGQRRWALRWIHEACDVQLTAIHEQFPIQSVTLNDGTKELDFDWWIPLKQEWWEIMT